MGSSPAPPGIRKLYVATDALSIHGYFDPLCRSDHFDCVFAKDLNADLVRAFHAELANQKLANDIFGVVEQLICVNAIYFLGTLYESSFTRQIYRMREQHDVTGFTFPEVTLTHRNVKQDP